MLQVLWCLKRIALYSYKLTNYKEATLLLLISNVENKDTVSTSDLEFITRYTRSVVIYNIYVRNWILVTMTFSEDSVLSKS
jgi:hypothetical protein